MKRDDPPSKGQRIMPRGGSGKQRSPVNAHVGKRLRQRRVQLGLSQTAVGKKLGLSYQQIQKYERGSALAADRLVQVAQALNVPISYFFEGLGDPNSSQAANDSILRPGEIRFITEMRRLPSPVRTAIHQLMLSANGSRVDDETTRGPAGEKGGERATTRGNSKPF